MFQRHGIDFCCGGDKALSVACDEHNVDFNTVIEELEQARESGETTENFSDWAPDFLADYIVNQHHAYAKKVIPQLNAFAKKVAKVHGEGHPVPAHSSCNE